MKDLRSLFIEHSARKAFDTGHRGRIAFNISKYDDAVKIGKEQFSDLELARKRAAYIRIRTLNNLEKHLIDFVSAFEKNGGQVIWAQDAEDAVNEILRVFEKADAKMAVKSKSMATEEIDLNRHLEDAGIEVIETDLGEYIVQIAGEKPYHIVTPAMHKSKEDIAELFREKFGLSAEATPEEITSFVRKKLRKKFMQADIGITGANFLIAETGSVCITENEGNAFLSSSVPRIHIAIAGIEKIVPSLSDLQLFWPLLATYGTGQNVTVYNSIVSGPRKAKEPDGPERMYLVLLDNGRTNLMAREKQKVALTCIKCGACLNACPVYTNIGGHAYNTTYSGPIGSVITPFLNDFYSYNHLSFASSLCGRCTEVCPVKIPLHEMLLHNRNEAVRNNHLKRSEKWSMSFMKKILMKRKRMDFLGAGQKNMLLRALLKKTWGAGRELPEIAPRSFRELWIERES